MTLILTGSPTRYGEDRFTTDNGLLAAVQAALPPRPDVLLVSASSPPLSRLRKCSLFVNETAREQLSGCFILFHHS